MQDDQRRLLLDDVSASFAVARELGDSASAEAAPRALQLLRGAQRSVRALLIYVRARSELVTRLRWELGAALPPQLAPALAPREQHFLDAYSRALTRYMERVQVDVTAQQQLPPKELLVQVMVLKDAGKVALDDGSALELKQGKRVYLRRQEAEPLIRQGVLQHL